MCGKEYWLSTLFCSFHFCLRGGELNMWQGMHYHVYRFLYNIHPSHGSYVLRLKEAYVVEHICPFVVQRAKTPAADNTCLLLSQFVEHAQAT